MIDLDRVPADLIRYRETDGMPTVPVFEATPAFDEAVMAWYDAREFVLVNGKEKSVIRAPFPTELLFDPAYVRPLEGGLRLPLLPTGHVANQNMLADLVIEALGAQMNALRERDGVFNWISAVAMDDLMPVEDGVRFPRQAVRYLLNAGSENRTHGQDLRYRHVVWSSAYLKHDFARIFASGDGPQVPGLDGEAAAAAFLSTQPVDVFGDILEIFGSRQDIRNPRILVPAVLMYCNLQPGGVWSIVEGALCTDKTGKDKPKGGLRDFVAKVQGYKVAYDVSLAKPEGVVDLFEADAAFAPFVENARRNLAELFKEAEMDLEPDFETMPIPLPY